jgi:hypothetical protein
VNVVVIGVGGAEPFLVGAALLAPEVAGEVKTTFLPEAAPRIRVIVNSTNLFRALPALNVGKHETKRPPMLGTERLTVKVSGEHRSRRRAVLEPDTAAVARERPRHGRAGNRRRVPPAR